MIDIQPTSVTTTTNPQYYYNLGNPYPIQTNSGYTSVTITGNVVNGNVHALLPSGGTWTISATPTYYSYTPAPPPTTPNGMPTKVEATKIEVVCPDCMLKKVE